MAMTVKNNMGAQRTLNTLNQNNKKLSKALSKVSSGMKIVGAGDGASEYAINEKMREMIRSLDQDSQNVQNGQSLLKTAAGGIDNIVEELRTLKELAIKSANDTNNDGDRLTIQKEFTQRMANINDIATTTEYNTKKLLDGTYARPPLGEPEKPFTVITAGNYTIEEDGVYQLAAGYTGIITVNAKNVKITQASRAALTNVSIIGPSGGNANLWIENLVIDNFQDMSVIKFQGSNNKLNVKGNNYMAIYPPFSVIYGATPQITPCRSAVINSGEELKIRGFGRADIFRRDGSTVAENTLPILCVENTGWDLMNDIPYGLGAAIGSDAYENSNGNIFVYEGLYLEAVANFGAGIGSGAGGSIGDIHIEENADVWAENGLSAGYGAGIDSGDGGSAGNITIGKNARVTASGNVDDESRGAAGIGSGRNGSVKDILIGKSAEIRGEVGAGYNGTAGAIRYVDDRDIPSKTERTEYAPLKIHHGTQANQATNFYIEDLYADN